jgi:hypothetical protein
MTQIMPIATSNIEDRKMATKYPFDFEKRETSRTN